MSAAISQTCKPGGKRTHICTTVGRHPGAAVPGCGPASSPARNTPNPKSVSSPRCQVDDEDTSCHEESQNASRSGHRALRPYRACGEAGGWGAEGTRPRGKNRGKNGQGNCGGDAEGKRSGAIRKGCQAAAIKATQQGEEKNPQRRVGPRRCPEGRVWGQLHAKGVRSRDGSGRGRGDRSPGRENRAGEPRRRRK